jgi:hypothetical protein
MSSATYTNKLRVKAESQDKKVQITNRQGITNKLIASIGCSPNYQPITYIPICGCSGRKFNT